MVKSNTSAALPPQVPNSKSKWKSIVSSIAKHVSQVGIYLLSIKRCNNGYPEIDSGIISDC